MPTQSKESFKCQGHHLLHTLSSNTCVRFYFNHAQMQVPSIKGRLTLKEVTVLDVVNLSARIQDAYLLWNSVRPIDMHTAFNRAIMDRPHVTNDALSTDGAHVVLNS